MSVSQSFNFINNINNSINSNNDLDLLVFYSDSDEIKSYSGRCIRKETAELQAAILASKIKSGEKILILIPFCFKAVASILAIMALGAIPVIPPSLTSFSEKLKFLYREGIKTLIVPQKSLGYSLGSLLTGFNIIVLPDGVSNDSSTLKIEKVPNHQPALITYTSGSTGNSKKILRSHKILQEQHLALKESFSQFKEQVDFPLFSIILLHNLSLGIKSIIPLLPKTGLKDVNPQTIVQQIKKEKVKTLTGNVFYFKKILNYLKFNPHQFLDVVAIGVGGSPVPEMLLYDIRCYFPAADIYVIYGSSEAEPIAIRHFKDDDNIKLNKGYKVGEVHPAISLEVKICGEVLVDNRKYNCGEILVKGNHVVVPPGEEYLSTGDFGYIDEENQLHLTGRKGNNRIHWNVQHYQIEHVLQHIEGVEQAACKSTEDGFVLYIKGRVGEDVVKAVLNKFFPKELQYTIYFKSHLPVDSRHFSKIIYKNL